MAATSNEDRELAEGQVSIFFMPRCATSSSEMFYTTQV
jgi:hypothetical protein